MKPLFLAPNRRNVYVGYRHNDLFIAALCISIGVCFSITSSRAAPPDLRIRGFFYCVTQVLKQTAGRRTASVDAKNDLPTSRPANQEAKIASWSVQEGQPAIGLEDLFPESYLQSLRQEFGNDLKMKVSHTSHSAGNSIFVEVKAADDLIAHFTLSESLEHPHAASISGLKLQNPLVDKVGGMMRKRKGLPSEVASHVKHAIFEIAKAAGFTQLRSEGASTFAVNFLYRKSVGMHAETKEGEAFQNFLDKVFQAARNRELPEGFRLKNLDQISNSLAHISTEVRESWRFYQKTNVLPAGMTVHRLSGIDVVTYDDGTQKQILFPRPAPRQSELLRWGGVRFDGEGQMESTLVLDLR